MAFEPNLGQAGRSVKFLSHAGRSTLTLTSTEAALSLPGVVADARPMGSLPKRAASALLGMTFIGADPSARVIGTDRLPGVSNYFIGNDPRQWRTSVPHYARVTYQEVYPGIDLTFYGNQSGRLEYDFTVSPGADPSVIELGIHGSSALTLRPSGDLVIGLGDHILIQARPRIYQAVNGSPYRVTGGYSLEGDRLGFALGSFDRSRPLVIDPEVEYSTYLGGSTGGEIGEAEPAADDSGHAYICGETNSTDFPVTDGAFQTEYQGGFIDAFVTKMNADGTGLVYSTYLGGTAEEIGVACALDRQGNAYIAGATTSTDFPTSPHAFQRRFAGGDGAVCPEPCDGYVAKLSPDGSSLIYSTYMGGSRDEWLVSLEVDRSGHAYAVGATSSTDFPTTDGAFQPSNGGGRHVSCYGDPAAACDYVALKLNPKGSGLIYSTYLGGPGAEFTQTKLAIDGHGDAYIAGATSSRRFPTTPGAFQRHYSGGPLDITLSKLNPTGSELLYSTYLGGSGEDSSAGVAVDPGGNAYLAGYTASTDFPVTEGAFQTTYQGGWADDFVTKVNHTGSGLVYSTYLGGSGGEGTFTSLIDRHGHVYVTGGTDSTDFPVTDNAFQSKNHGNGDGTVTELTADGSGLVFSTYWGGSGTEGITAVLDRSGNLYGTGCTESTDFPTTEDAFQTRFQGGTGGYCLNPSDAFVTKIEFDEDDDQAKAVQRGPSQPARARLRDDWGWGRGFLLGRNM